VGRYGGRTAHAPSEFARWGEPDPAVTRQTDAFAEILLDEMTDALPIPNRGIREGAYAVLAGATMPALLVECGFLTNRQDARQLSQEDFQAKVADAVARGILSFRAQGAPR
jgi:N-acetylmuramoyl-L-alanine amidase